MLTIPIRLAASERVLLLLYFLTLFQNPIQHLTGFSAADELLLLFCLFAVALFLVVQKGVCWLPPSVCRSLGCFGAMLLLALLGNLAFGYQAAAYALYDLFSEIRLWAGLLAGLLFFPRGLSAPCCRALAQISAACIVLYFLWSVHDFFFAPFGQLFASRWPFLFFTNITSLVAYMVLLLCVLTLVRPWVHGYPALVGMALTVISLTGRSKAWGFAFLAVLLLLLVRIKRWPHLLFLSPLAVGGCVALTWDKITQYFFSTALYSPRRVLLDASVSLAAQHFPLGTGLGTYCSVGSILSLSPLYAQIGYSLFDAVYDIFWGNLLGQSGFLGTALFVAGVGFLFWGMLHLLAQRLDAFLAGCLALFYLCIASLGECSFFSAYSLGFGVLLGLAFGAARADRQREGANV